MTSIVTWANGLAEKILQGLWYLMQNMLIPIMSGLAVLFCLLCIYQAVRSYHDEDRMGTQRNVKGAIVCLFIAVSLLGLWTVIPKTAFI